jgi:hypothetical protein
MGMHLPYLLPVVPEPVNTTCLCAGQVMSSSTVHHTCCHEHISLIGYVTRNTTTSYIPPTTYSNLCIRYIEYQVFSECVCEMLQLPPISAS